MRTAKPLHRTFRTDDFDTDDFGEGAGRSDAAEEFSEWAEPPLSFAVRVICPDCAQSIPLEQPDAALPEHAWCPTRWNPFGLTVCRGSGRAVPVSSAGAFAPGDSPGDEQPLLVALPESLDWRLQPFSHVGGEGSRPVRAVRMEQAA
ncbi:hypothetical protein PJ985_14990 [Streptomyces sp. ACA25]|uniref:hypothetical protein n=1 Tax=Streptomyces sp. ACA25 TaxID=3022596 RepID=UPI002307D6A1|nr:hypothetical protein [Streptomyces sp. ACA25]MDB1088872.1 hypothetical protein [Streptomyces sp. ACA25]